MNVFESLETFGNIVCCRDLSEQTDEAIALFGDKDAKGTILLRSFDDYYNGFTDEKNNLMGDENFIICFVNCSILFSILSVFVSELI